MNQKEKTIEDKERDELQVHTLRWLQFLLNHRFERSPLNSHPDPLTEPVDDYLFRKDEHFKRCMIDFGEELEDESISKSTESRTIVDGIVHELLLLNTLQ